MREIGNEVFISKEELKHELITFLKEGEMFNDNKSDPLMSLMTGAIVLDFIKFVFKEGEEE